ncbi:MAG: hypothetical protein ACI841_002074 [Planctomycetota bacterium]|jgi:hypothetical protein
MQQHTNNSASRTKDPICVLLVWLGTIAFLCCVAGDAGAQSASILALAADSAPPQTLQSASADRVQLCLTALVLWSLAALSAGVHARKTDALEQTVDQD